MVGIRNRHPTRPENPYQERESERVMAKFIVYKKVQFELQIEVEANNEAEAVELAKESGDWEQLDGNEETYEAVTA